MSVLAILLFIGTFGFSMWASYKVKHTYNKYSQIPARSGYTGAECASKILDAAGIHDVEIVQQDGMLSDHYDPMNKRLVLSTENFQGTSTAALGVSAHECGHAIQHKIAYAPLQWRMMAVGVTTYANQAVMWLPLIGLFTGFLNPANISLYLTVMCVAWGIIMLFNLVTLPVEFDASRRAKVVLGKMNFIDQGDEATAVKKVLDAAAWTYVAAFLTSLLYFLWYLLPLLMGRRDD